MYTICVPPAVIMGPVAEPMSRPDPDRSRWSKKMSGVCVVSDGKADMSLAATARRMEAATMLRPLLPREEQTASRASGQQIRPATEQTAAEFSDTDVIVSVAPNPKKPGSATHERYKLYQEGSTIAHVRALGITLADLRWDIARGFVQLRK